jgi:carboxyl-terminal processing protease
MFLVLLAFTVLAQQAANKPSDIRFGIVLVKTNGNLAISSVMGQAAYDAGLRPRQIIKQIDGHSTADMTVEQGVQAMKGAAGSKVDLEIIKPGQASPAHVQLTRSVFVPLKSVTDRIIDSNIGVLTVRMLELDSGANVRKALDNFKEKEVKAIILDLRDNGGGYLKSAQDIASLFLDKACILWISKYKDREQIEHSNPENVWTAPVLVLVNGGTGSGAEILASSLQLNGRARIVGEKTAGHASINSKPNAAAAPIKVGTFLNAKREELDGKGVQPDVVIETTAPDETVLARAAEIFK